jgi:hypothetical protein
MRTEPRESEARADVEAEELGEKHPVTRRAVELDRVGRREALIQRLLIRSARHWTFTLLA